MVLMLAMHGKELLLKSDGKMAKNERVDGGRYYVDASGLGNHKSDKNLES